jgi:hypothetical protein
VVRLLLEDRKTRRRRMRNKKLKRWKKWKKRRTTAWKKNRKEIFLVLISMLVTLFCNHITSLLTRELFCKKTRLYFIIVYLMQREERESRRCLYTDGASHTGEIAMSK